MSSDGSIRFDWGGATRTFRLAIGELRLLQEELRVSPFAVLDRMQRGAPMVDDMSAVMRLGLEGGGETPAGALLLIRRYVHERPLGESITPAVLVLASALYGAEGDEPGESSGVADGPTASPPTAD
jgi:hypothetical protein